MKTSDLVDRKDLLIFFQTYSSLKIASSPGALFMLIPQWPEPSERLFCQKETKAHIRTNEEIMQN